MNEQKKMCYLKEQIYSLFDLLPVQIECSRKTIEENIDVDKFKKFRKVILVGSGDSYMSVQSGKRAFDKYAKKYAVYYNAMKAMEFSRFNEFNDIEANKNTLVVLISKSGVGCRAIEVIKRANSLGMSSLVVTNVEDSEACKLAKYHLLTNTPSFDEDKPALRSYFAALITLYLLAAKFSEIHGNEMTLDKMSNDINDYMMLYKNKIELYDKKMFELAKLHQNANSITLIGDSDEEASCNFCVSKIIEVTGIHSKCDDSEEWGHINYFNQYIDTNPVFFMANTHYNNISRIKETMHQAIAVGRPVYLVINEDGQKIDDISKENIIYLPDVEDEMLQPLGSYIPVTLFATHLANLLNEPLFRGKNYPKGFNTIRNSEVVIVGGNGSEIIG